MPFQRNTRFNPTEKWETGVQLRTLFLTERLRSEAASEINRIGLIRQTYSLRGQVYLGGSDKVLQFFSDYVICTCFLCANMEKYMKGKTNLLIGEMLK